MSDVLGAGQAPTRAKQPPSGGGPRGRAKGGLGAKEAGGHRRVVAVTGVEGPAGVPARAELRIEAFGQLFDDVDRAAAIDRSFHRGPFVYASQVTEAHAVGREELEAEEVLKRSG